MISYNVRESQVTYMKPLASPLMVGESMQYVRPDIDAQREWS